LIGRGIVGLPIHDSFIVEERHAGILKEIMDEVLSLTLRRVGGRRTTPTPLTKKVPQYGGGGEQQGAGRPSPLRVVLVESVITGSVIKGKGLAIKKPVIAGSVLTEGWMRRPSPPTTMMSEGVIVVPRDASCRPPFIGCHSFFYVAR